MGSPFADQGGGGLAVDDDGNLYFSALVGGLFLGFDQIGVSDSFYGKISPSGEILWVNRIGQIGFVVYSTPPEYVARRNSIYFTVNAWGMHYDWNIPHIGNRDNVMVRWSADGALIWARRVSSSADEVPRRTLYVPWKDCIALGGFIEKASSLDPVLFDRGNWDMYYVCVDENHNVVARGSGGSPNLDEMLSFSVDPYNQLVYLIGVTGALLAPGL